MMRPGRSLASGLRFFGMSVALIITGASGVSAQDEALPVAGAVSVRGSSTLVDQLDPGVTTVEGGVIRTRGAVLITVEESSDARVSGRATIDLNVDAYPGPDGTPGVAQVRWGEVRLENDAGAWEGWFTGRQHERGFLQTYWLAGEGAYEGLSYVVTAGGNGNVWLSDGLVFPGELPPAGGANRLPLESPGRDLPTALPLPA